MVLFAGCTAAQQDFYIRNESDFVLRDILETQNPAFEGDYLHTNDVQCEAELLYQTFLESDYWLRVRCFQCCGNLMQIPDCGNWRVTDKKIFDFDGVPNLWFRAVWSEEDFISPRWSGSITGFATVEAGEVVLLLSGYTSGGSIGGDFVAFGYYAETSEYVIVLRSFSGGFGGNYIGASIYSVRAGGLTRLHQIAYTYFWASHHGGEGEHIFEVNGERVCYDVYAQIANRVEARDFPPYRRNFQGRSLETHDKQHEQDLGGFAPKPPPAF